MTDDAQPTLLDYLGKRYATIKRQLTHMLGNADLASDALHDTWVRLKDKDDAKPIENPGGYLVRMAVNIAVDTQRRQSRMLSGDDVDALLDEMVDSAPRPEQIAEIRSELDAMMEIVGRMPKRRREILIMVNWEGVLQKEAARRLKISLRTVEYELKNAQDTLNAHLEAGKK